MVVSYEEFCNNPTRQLENIRYFLAKRDVNIEMKKEYNINIVANRNKNFMDVYIIEELKKNLKSYFGE